MPRFVTLLQDTKAGYGTTKNVDSLGKVGRGGRGGNLLLLFPFPTTCVDSGSSQSTFIFSLWKVGVISKYYFQPLGGFEVISEESYFQPLEIWGHLRVLLFSLPVN